MKIDLLITELFTGGAERCCTELAGHLQALGHSVRVISIAPAPTTRVDSLLYEHLKALKIQTVFLNASKSYQLPWAHSRLVQWIRSDPPDLVQSFLWHANLLGAWCYSKHQIPQVAGVRVVEPRRWRSRLAWFWRCYPKKVVCVSHEVARWASRYEGFDSDQLAVIPNGIDLDVIPASAKREKILLFVGRLEPQKGIDVLLERTPAILQALPEHRLVLIGDGSWAKAWSQWAQHSPLAHRVERLGRRADVLDWMARSELLLLPTRYEGMPNVVLEAMAVGLPIATRHVEGIEDLLGSSLNEQSAPRDDWDAWEKLLIGLAQNPLTLERLGIFNRKRVEENFDLHAQMKKYELLYQEILSKLPTRRGPAL
jgi:glycosyltransferase involved in cell wall biosynthesis